MQLFRQRRKAEVRPCALLVLVLASALGAPPAAASSLRGDMEAALQEQGLAGVVWGTLSGDGTVETGAAGVKDARTGEPLRPDDRVHIGSVAKTVLAAGVLKLVTDGKLSLATPVSTVLPDLDFRNPWEAQSPIRIRHLLDHTSGLDDSRLWHSFSLKAEPDTPLSKAFEGDDDLLRVRVEPGTRFSYSNIGYALLGMAIERVTGQRYEQYLDENLLRPLGMNDSTFSFVSQVGRNADSRLAMGHFEAGETHAAVAVYVRPAMQFTTTAKDMMTFAAFLMSDGRIDGQSFIDASLLRAMGQQYQTEAARAGLKAGYGLGLGTRDRNGVTGRCHTGNTVGFWAMLCVFPEEGRAHFLAMNADSEGADYWKFDALLMDASSLRRTEPQPRGPLPAGIEAWEGFYVPAPARFETFAWLDTTLGFARLRKDGERLVFQPFMGRQIILDPVDGMLFRRVDRSSTASHALLVDEEGRRFVTTGTATFGRVPLLKLTALWLSLVAGIAGVLYVLLTGVARVLKRTLAPSDPMFLPFLGVVALLLPIPLFFTQSFMQLGDMTVASMTLAAVTALLPVALMFGLLLRWRRGASVRAVVEMASFVAVLQLTVVLYAWDLWPVMLWR